MSGARQVRMRSIGPVCRHENRERGPLLFAGDDIPEIHYPRPESILYVHIPVFFRLSHLLLRGGKLMMGE